MPDAAVRNLTLPGQSMSGAKRRGRFGGLIAKSKGRRRRAYWHSPYREGPLVQKSEKVPCIFQRSTGQTALFAWLRMGDKAPRHDV